MSIFDEHIEDFVPITHSYLLNTSWQDISYPYGYMDDPYAPNPCYSMYSKRFNSGNVEATLYSTINNDCERVYKLKLYSFVTHSHIIIHSDIMYTDGLDLMIQKYELI
jgi:hypothetical protein